MNYKLTLESIPSDTSTSLADTKFSIGGFNRQRGPSIGDGNGDLHSVGSIDGGVLVLTEVGEVLQVSEGGRGRGGEEREGEGFCFDESGLF